MTRADAPISDFPRGHPNGRPSKAARIVSSDYPPGWFVGLVLKHNFPPRFSPQLRSSLELWRSEIARQNRERRMDAGETGTIVGLSRKADAQRRPHRRTK